MRRGFKTEAKSLALEVRAEIGLGPHVPFDPYALAKLYGVDVFSIEDVPCSPDARAFALSVRPGAFSGALIPVGTGMVIVENSAHALVRRRSTTSHEVSHLVLEHQFTATIVNDRGCRTADPDQEAEATELAGELLIPFVAARRLARAGATNHDVARHFDVSPEVARWRMDATGARKIAAREAAVRKKRSFGQPAS